MWLAKALHSKALLPSMQQSHSAKSFGQFIRMQWSTADCQQLVHGLSLPFAAVARFDVNKIDDTVDDSAEAAGMICAIQHASSSRQREGTKTWQGSPSGRGVGVAEAAAQLPSEHLWLLTGPPPRQNQLLPHLSSPAHGTR